MRHALVAAIAGALLLVGPAASAQEQDLEPILRFELPRKGEGLRGWDGGPSGTIHFDSTVVHDGGGAVRLERDAESPDTFSRIRIALPVYFEGEWIELRGFLRTDGVTDFAGLWMRLDGPSGPLQFDNMYEQNVQGTTDWAEYSIRLPLDPKAGDLVFGVLLMGEGTAWADDLQLLVDGKPVDEAPEAW